jgi:TolB-like protein
VRESAESAEEAKAVNEGKTERMSAGSARAEPILVRKSKSVMMLAGVALTIALLAIIIIYFRPLTARSTSAQPRRLAVLPFRNLKPDPETDFLSLSLADAVITKLSYVGSLTVSPSSYVAKYRQQEVDLKQVAAELGVNTVLASSYLKEGDALRITTQLVDVSRREPLWAETINLKYERLLTVQDEVARQIIQGLSLKLTAAEAERLRRDVPQDPLAYEYFLRGVDLYSMNDFRLAVKMLQKSVSLDPKYSHAWAHLGRSFTAKASLEFGGREDYRNAQAAYEQSLALDPEQIEGRIFLANFYTDTGRVEQSVPLLRAVLKSNPNYPEAHWELGYAYRFGGMLKESVTEGELARQLDPQVKLNNSAFNSYLYLGQYERFIQSLPAREDSAFILFYRGFGYYHLRDQRRATSDFDRAYDLQPWLLQAQIGKALGYGMTGQRREGIALLQETERKVEEQGVSDAEAIYKLAQAYAELGDRAAALRLLRRSITGGFFCYPYFVTDPLLNNLRREAEFTELLEKARQRHEEFKGKFF